MSTETEENTKFTRNGDNMSSITTNSGSGDVAENAVPNPLIEERLVSKMFSCSIETICLILAITFSLAFAALHSVPPKISTPPPARPFFNQNSIIIDFYEGQLNAMIERTSDADLNFVMYYAPWDAESQVVRYEFERAAQHYHSKIFFSAINCWHPGSECRNQYSKIPRYPVLIFYPARTTGFSYSGIYSAPYIMRFLDAFLNPIRRISNQIELMKLLEEHDSVMVGFFNFKGSVTSPGYREFYKTAIWALQRDPNRNTIFAVVTSASTASLEFNIEHTPSASLYLWNESFIYPEDKFWTSANVLEWMERSMHKVSFWLQPPGVKSSTLAPYLHNGPVLLLFTPRNPLHPYNYNYNLLREIALEYYSCGHDMLALQLMARLRIKNENSEVEHHNKVRQCLTLTTDFFAQPSTTPLPLSIPVQQWINDSCAKVFINKCLLCESDDSTRNNVCNVAPSKLNEICMKDDLFKVLNSNEPEEHTLCCKNHRLSDSKKMKEKVISSGIIGSDPRSASMIRLRYIHDDCMNFLAGDKYHYPIFPEKSKDKSVISLNTSACDMNRTMTFLAIDSLNYFHFAEGLGVDVLNIRDKTAVIILDSLRESQYVMTENLSRNSLVKFINYYSSGDISRTLRSDTIRRRYARDPQVNVMCKNKTSREVCIPELNTETFLTTILNPKKDVVVMYHSPYCAFCSAIAYVYLTVASLLSKVNRIMFTRIDGDNNDLPWEYSMNRYPSILFLPAKRKEDSTLFPSSLPITVPNVLNFILANLEGDTHIEALINICHKNSAIESIYNCVAKIRRSCLDYIRMNLQNYRKLLRYSKNSQQSNSDIIRKRREILLKLGHIRDIHLILSFIDNLNKETNKYHQLLEKFNTYYKNLTIIKNETVSVYSGEMTGLKKQKKINDEL